MSCESGTCATNQPVHGASSGQPSACQPPCGPGACACPVEQSIDKWTGAFCQALTAVQAELLKDRIKKTWGPVLEKEADAVVQAMGVAWQSKLAFAKAQVGLRDQIRQILESTTD